MISPNDFEAAQEEIDRYTPICWDCSTPIEQVEVDAFDGYCTHCYGKRYQLPDIV